MHKTPEGKCMKNAGQILHAIELNCLVAGIRSEEMRIQSAQFFTGENNKKNQQEVEDNP